MDHGMDDKCSLCKSNVESIDHLFLHCTWTKLLWSICTGWWDVSFCANQTIKQWVDGWSGLCPESKNKRAWGSLLFAVFWTTWEARNKMVFEGLEVNMDQAIDLVKFRVVWWFKHFGKGSKDTVTALLLNIKELCVENKIVKSIKMQNWVPTMANCLKFNVHGSARGKPGVAGIGGILRDRLVRWSVLLGLEGPGRFWRSLCPLVLPSLAFWLRPH
ncbi:hypothetical protein Dsin_007061 [Dipteronia sinensis]|uniref:Reverse transcriptase zinc-binding domain-containing protein n=1 Tax=Dipteronia sinensis TaxID=43782 RepID=A0AAE0EGH2_9ROSI|nr:hypothetical protein Dsin_007061 [Dipteronia sinensis]